MLHCCCKYGVCATSKDFLRCWTGASGGLTRFGGKDNPESVNYKTLSASRVEHPHLRSYFLEAISLSSVFRNLFWTLPIRPYATGGATMQSTVHHLVSFKIWCLSRTRPAPYHGGLFLFFFLLVHMVKHFVFKRKIASLCEEDHCYVKEVEIIVPYHVHVGCRFSVFQVCSEYKVWRTTCPSR
jgi:hypothetical protein